MGEYLRLEPLELGLLGFLVFFNLLLSFAACVLDLLGAVCRVLMEALIARYFKNAVVGIVGGRDEMYVQLRAFWTIF